MLKRILAGLVVGAAGLHIGSAIATPLTYALSGTVGFHIDGSAYVGLDYRIPVLGLGPYSLGHDVAFSGDMTWDVSGTATVDWGSPGWSGQFVLSASNFNLTPQAGSSVHVTAPIDVNVDVAFVHVHQHYDPGAYLNAQSFSYELNAATGTLISVNPTAGPWAALLADALPLPTDVPVCIGLTSGGCLPGNTFLWDLTTGVLLPSQTLLAGLSRDGVTASDPLGTGTTVALGLPVPAEPGSQGIPDFVNNMPGCEVDLGFLGCYFDLLDEGVWWNGPIHVSNFNFLVSGTTSTAVAALDIVPGSVPEPGTIALFGIGLAALGFSRRRKRA